MKKTLVIFSLTLLYATIRYNIFKGVPWSDWPLYVMNKSCALTALILLARYVVLRAGTGTDDAEFVNASRLFFLMHGLLSFTILMPGYFPDYYAGTTFTPLAGISLFIGIAVFSVLMGISRKRVMLADETTNFWLALLAFGAGVHAALPGFMGWFQPAKWPGYMAPITLISFVCGCTALAAVVVNKLTVAGRMKKI